MLGCPGSPYNLQWVIRASIRAFLMYVQYNLYPPGGSGWIISVGDYADNSFAALGSSDPREVRLEL